MEGDLFIIGFVIAYIIYLLEWFIISDLLIIIQFFINNYYLFGQNYTYCSEIFVLINLKI